MQSSAVPPLGRRLLVFKFCFFRCEINVDLRGSSRNRTDVRDTRSRHFIHTLGLSMLSSSGGTSCLIYVLRSVGRFRFTPGGVLLAGPALPDLLFLGCRGPIPLRPRGREERCRCRWHLYVTWVETGPSCTGACSHKLLYPVETRLPPKFWDARRYQTVLSMTVVYTYHEPGGKFTSCWRERALFPCELERKSPDRCPLLPSSFR